MRDMDMFIGMHLYTALLAVLLSALQLLLPKGQSLHRSLGYVWILLMVLVALSSFAIHEIKQFGQFSWIHGLSVITLISMLTAIMHARRGAIAAHRRNMIFLLLGLYIAGAFTLLPGRRLGDWLWG